MDRPIMPLPKGIPLQQFKELFQELSELTRNALPKQEPRKPEPCPPKVTPTESGVASTKSTPGRAVAIGGTANPTEAKMGNKAVSAPIGPSTLSALGKGSNPALGHAVVAAAQARAEREKQYRTEARSAAAKSGAKIVRNRMEAPSPPSSLDFSRTLPPEVSASPKIKPLSPGAVPSGATLMALSEEQDDQDTTGNGF